VHWNGPQSIQLPYACAMPANLRPQNNYCREMFYEWTRKLSGLLTLCYAKQCNMGNFYSPRHPVASSFSPGLSPAISPHFTLLPKVNGYTRRNSWPQFMGHVTLPRPKNNAIETLTSVGQRSYVKYNSSTRNSKLPTASRSITLKVSSCLTSQQESAYLPGERAFLTGLMCRNFQI